jgi:hypothetical protein
MPATPTTNAEKTSGSTTISSRRSQRLPKGEVMLATVHSSCTSSGPSSTLASRPATTPTNRPSMIFTYSGRFFGVLCSMALRRRVRKKTRSGEGAKCGVRMGDSRRDAEA